MNKQKAEKTERNIILLLVVASMIGSAYVMTKVSPLLKEAAEKQKQNQA